MGVRAISKVPVFLEAIKVGHSVFALPFAVSSAFLAAGGLPPLPLLGKVILAVVLARTAAMAFNRWADAGIDEENPRTARRAVPAGLISKGSMGTAAAVSAAGFIATCAWIHHLAFVLSPLALIVLLGYSYTKRFTSLSHAVLGAALGLSPVGAWIAVREDVAWTPVVLGLAVLFWTAGFDIIYACQDRDFDRARGLRSLPATLGLRRALVLSRCSHAITVALLAAVGAIAGLGVPYVLGVLTVAALLVREHSMVSADDLSRVDTAFFTLNGVVSLVFMGTVILETVV